MAANVIVFVVYIIGRLRMTMKLCYTGHDVIDVVKYMVALKKRSFLLNAKI